MCKDSVDARAIIHRKVQTRDTAVAPSYYRDLVDAEVVQERESVAGEVIVVERCEVCVRRTSLSACAVRKYELIESIMVDIRGSSWAVED